MHRGITLTVCFCILSNLGSKGGGEKTHVSSQAALKHGVQSGRRGFGSIFVVASGNGGLYSDNCNYDGYANSIYTVTVGKKKNNNV